MMTQGFLVTIALPHTAATMGIFGLGTKEELRITRKKK